MVIIIGHLEWRSSSPSSDCPGHSSTLNTFTIMQRLGMGGAHVAATSVQAKPGTRCPKSWPTALSQRKEHWSISSWRSGTGGKVNRLNFQRRRSSLLPFHHMLWLHYCSCLIEHFINNVPSWCPSRRWCAQVAASRRTFSCNNMAKCQSRVLAGQSGDGGRWLRQGGGSSARLLTVRPLSDAVKSAVFVSSWILLNFVIFTVFFLFVLAVFS